MLEEIFVFFINKNQGISFFRLRKAIIFFELMRKLIRGFLRSFQKKWEKFVLFFKRIHLISFFHLSFFFM